MTVINLRRRDVMAGLPKQLTRIRNVSIRGLAENLVEKIPLPRSHKQIEDEIEPYLAAMEADGRTWYSDLAKTMDFFAWGQGKFGVYPAGGCAYSPGGLHVDNYKLQQHTLGQFPAVVTKWQNGQEVEIGRVEDFGRMNGSHGWSSDKMVMAGGITLPRRINLGALLSLFKDLPGVPFRDQWELPAFNTDKSGVFVIPSSVFAYQMNVPSPIMRNTFTIRTPTTDTQTVYIATWNPDRSTAVGTTAELSGSTAYTVSTFFLNPPRTGFIEITPEGCTQGAVITDVYNTPPII